MKWFIDIEWPIPKRPKRMARITFCAFSGLFIIATPFIEDVPRLLFLSLGIAYSAVLAFTVVGVCLLGRSKKAIISLILFSTLLFLSLSIPIIYGQISGDHSGAVEAIGIVTTVSIWIMCGILIFIFALAAGGWKRYFHGHHEAQQDGEGNAN